MSRPYTVRRFKGTPDEVREQWLESRKNGLGGSDCATVLGINKYKSPLTLWLEKTRREKEEDLSNREPIYWGNVLEDVVAAEFAKRHPEYKVERRNQQYVSTIEPFMFADIDRIIIDGDRRGVLECKTCGSMRERDWADGVPNYYLTQVLHYLFVTGYEYAWVAVLIGGQKYKEFMVERDDEDIEFIVSREREFWGYVESDTMPQIVGMEDETASLRAVFPQTEGIGFISIDEHELIAKYMEANEDEKDASSRKRYYGNLLRCSIGEQGVTSIEDDLYKVTWSRTSSTRIDTKRLIAEMPEIAERFIVHSERDMGIRIKRK